MDPLDTVAVEPTGQFTLTMPDTGLNRILVTAVGHRALSVPLDIPVDLQSLTMDVVLKSHDYLAEFDQVFITGSWREYNRRAAEPMIRQSDGTFLYRYSGTADRIGYQLLGLLDDPMHSVNGTHSDSYSYDGGGDYISVLETHGAPRTIVFDPSGLIRMDSKDLPGLHFNPSSETLTRLWTIEQTAVKGAESFLEAASRFMKEHPGEKTVFEYDWRNTLSSLEAAAGNPADPKTQQFAAAQLLNLSSFPSVVEPSAVRRYVGMIPPESGIWSAVMLITLDLFDPLGADEAIRLMTSLSERNPDRNVRAIALGHLAMKHLRAGHTDQAQSVYRALRADYSDITFVQPLLEQLNPDKAIQPGKPVPDFILKLTDGTTITRESMMGKYYLIDFWATWCKPCITEMEHLHRSFEKYKLRKFTIVSVSLDVKWEEVESFRKGKWKMPWLHVFPGPDAGQDLAMKFEVLGIPKPVLIDPKGVIVAMEIDLRGDNLDKTLERNLVDSAR